MTRFETREVSEYTKLQEKEGVRRSLIRFREDGLIKVMYDSDNIVKNISLTATDSICAITSKTSMKASMPRSSGN